MQANKYVQGKTKKTNKQTNPKKLQAFERIFQALGSDTSHVFSTSDRFWSF